MLFLRPIPQLPVGADQSFLAVAVSLRALLGLSGDRPTSSAPIDRLDQRSPSLGIF
jgi:hypothetical protein